ncbi:hypothetical protein JQ611_11265 [Bradyrhizobium sp. AUGA SZCCT0182]|nr:hypothetical protein [Bradyrhizobium sp. AUGA SZCCT0182]
MIWSGVALPPLKHELRAIARGDGAFAKAGIAVNRVTRHSMALAAGKPISVLLKLAIIDLALTRVANLKIVSLCDRKVRLGSHSRLRN